MIFIIGTIFFFNLKFQGFVKIARWTDMNYWALKQTTEKTHRALHKQMKAFQVCSGGWGVIEGKSADKCFMLMFIKVRSHNAIFFIIFLLTLICFRLKLHCVTKANSEIQLKIWSASDFQWTLQWELWHHNYFFPYNNIMNRFIDWKSIVNSNQPS